MPLELHFKEKVSIQRFFFLMKEPTKKPALHLLQINSDSILTHCKLDSILTHCKLDSTLTVATEVAACMHACRIVAQLTTYKNSYYIPTIRYYFIVPKPCNSTTNVHG